MESRRKIEDITRLRAGSRYSTWQVRASCLMLAAVLPGISLAQSSATQLAASAPPIAPMKPTAAQGPSVASNAAASASMPLRTPAAPAASGMASSASGASALPSASNAPAASTPQVVTEEQLGKSYGWIVASALALLSLLVSVLAVLLSILTVWRNWSIARVNIVANCHKTYGDIFGELFELREEFRLQGPVLAAQAANLAPPVPLPVIKSRAHKLFIKLWNLQHEQYLYFREGLVPQPIFEAWLKYRHADYRSADYDFNGVNYQWTWDTRKAEFGNHGDFVRFMDLAMDTANIHANAQDAAERALKEAMQLYSQSTEASNLKRHWARIVDFYKH